MKVEFDAIAAYLGELYAAARHDISTADPADVGLDGVSIVAWRKAYAEGCYDMAGGVITHLPVEHREECKAAVLAAFEKERARLANETEAAGAERQAPQFCSEGGQPPKADARTASER